MQGLGVYWCVVEMLYEEGGYMPLEYERITFELRVEEDVVRDVITAFDLFEIEDEKFSSSAVLERISIQKQKSEKARKSADYRWGSGVDANAVRTQSDRNANKVKKNKIKENKIKVSVKSADEPTKRFTPPELLAVEDYCKMRKNTVNAQKWYDYYESKGWLIGKSPMKDWKAAVRTWEHNSKDGFNREDKASPFEY